MKSICNQCRIGRLHEIQVPYVREYQGQLLVIPNVPAGICDMCDEVAYDMAYMARLLCLLDPDFLPEAEELAASREPQGSQVWRFL